MKIKYIFIIITLTFLMSLYNVKSQSGFCFDNNNIIANTTINNTVNGVTTTNIINILIPCPFGCNSLLNKCNDSPYAISSNNFFDVLIIIFFLGNLVVLFLKIYNLSRLCEGYSKYLIFITMVFSLISWFIMMTYLSFKPSMDTTLWMTFTNLITSINFFLMMMEILIIGVQYILSKRTKAREPLILNRPRRP